MVEPENVVLRLLQYFKSQTEIADFCLVDRSAVTHWKYNNRIPPWHAAALSRKTGLDKQEICPHEFGHEKGEIDVSDGISNEGAGQDR